MPYLEEGELHEKFANNPRSLEGRLLFAVPKSESISKNSEIFADMRTLRGETTASCPEFT